MAHGSQPYKNNPRPCSNTSPSMSNLNEAMRKSHFRDIDAWDALRKRDLEYAINLLVSGEWTINGDIKDGWDSLDARVGGERCHETALLALILRRIVIAYLRDSKLLETFKALVTEYRAEHAQDKRWTKVFKVQDIYVDDSDRYKHIIKSIINFIGPDWTTFIGSARTLASFSVLSTMECGLSVYYRRLGDVLVATSKEQRAAGMGEYYDAEYPLRTTFTHISFKLIEKLSAEVLTKGVSESPFGAQPRAWETLPEQAREMLCWQYKIPITLCMPRLRYENAPDGATSMATYKLTSAPVRTYISTNESCGSFKMVDTAQKGIEDEPCWKLGGYSMYHESQPGTLLSSANDGEYIEALEQSDVGHLLSLFGFVHRVDLVALRSSICGGTARSAELSLEGVHSGWGLSSIGQANNLGLLSLSIASDKIARQCNLNDTVLAHQHNIAARSSYQMQCKPIPFTFDHIDISTPRHEQSKWAGILRKHLSTTEPMYANLFVIGNTCYGMKDEAEADRLMQVNNDREKIESLLQRHPGHDVFLTTDHKAKLKRSKEETRKKKFICKIDVAEPVRCAIIIAGFLGCLSLYIVIHQGNAVDQDYKTISHLASTFLLVTVILSIAYGTQQRNGRRDGVNLAQVRFEAANRSNISLWLPMALNKEDVTPSPYFLKSNISVSALSPKSKSGGFCHGS
ncbi:uncharacterized protein BKA55DRAFT_598150 [Fusarium redolens]|uniref:Uncharacterized protein n=1 Tax=Fusarium redolens TaxID=48865 RepID=A0A9P9JUN0_FUSRE|nr:uncharacterized protein BKA55DRAFT_598150 [Fusarium redolens]KAH7233966.1 hypothetical protein BKA55DRAFT_598150 [Fusarium redolens]